MIRPMKKIILGARSQDKDILLKTLRGAGIVHVMAASEMPIVAPAHLEKAIEDNKKAMEILMASDSSPDGMEQKAKMASGQTDIENLRIDGANKQTDIEKQDFNGRSLDEKIAHILQLAAETERLKAERMALTIELDSISSWGLIGLKDINFLREQGIECLILKGPLKDLSEIASEGLEILENAGDASVFCAFSRSKIEYPQDFSIVPLPRREAFEIESLILESKKKSQEIGEILRAYSSVIPELSENEILLLNQKNYALAEAGLLLDDELVFLTGYCPENQVDALSQLFKDKKLPVALLASQDFGEEKPPTDLVNAPWVDSVKPMYDFMGVMPDYNEPDTSPLFLVMLMVFGAFLVADAGYGLLVLIASIAGYRPLLKKGMDKDFLHLAMLISGAIGIYGIFTNSWFGEEFHLIPGYAFDPGTDQGSILLQGLCFLMGVTHLTVAHIIKIRRRKLELTHLADIGWILFLWAMYGVVCSLILKQDFVLPWDWVMPLFYISVTLIILFTAPSWNIFSLLASGIGAIVLNAANCFSDIISYIRLWAVGLAGGKVAGAFNNIAGDLPFLVRIPVYILGHGVNIILGIIAILAHGVRLNLLEFSNHLELEWTGRKYEPFKEIK